MSTHPPLEKRISAIDPYFNGQFQHIMLLPRPSDDDSQEVKKANSNLCMKKTSAGAREEGEIARGIRINHFAVTTM